MNACITDHPGNLFDDEVNDLESYHKELLDSFEEEEDEDEKEDDNDNGGLWDPSRFDYDGN